MDAESDLTKSSFSDFFNKLVIIELCRWQLSILLQVELVVADETFALPHDVVIYSEFVRINH